MRKNIILVGCGKMGRAMLDGWLEGGTMPSRVTAVEPFAETAQSTALTGVTVVEDAGKLPGDAAPDIVVFAVKPQMLPEVAPAYKRFVGPGTVFLSIAAGRPIRFFEDALGAGAAVVRAMPNTPAAVHRGITAACRNAPVTDRQRKDCDALLRAVGEVVWLDDEALMDAVTAVSGSGPAYVFLLIETLAAAGEKAGLPADLAAKLARATVTGSGELARRSAEPAATLRKNVTSPGGTTEAALKVLMADDGLGPLMERAVDAAARRSRELA